ncbi:hypothetical protein SEA_BRUTONGASTER_163 [Gordonia phage BrutonGaster]|uniref:Uncharacterized protein n=1 Tax=Gordonia phage BrutonGaster TaxID=2530116 RepID=A0A482JLW4_9CAUD|nr:hypothetical protein HOV26_gp019 [Gordonia phage BrutonGaster]QBP33377.1 hypothetical protein SEA_BRUTONGASTER_163 [Gordonia phage BrutonGaster]
MSEYIEPTTGRELDSYDLHEMFDEFVDEIQPAVEILGIHYNASLVLKEVSTIDYQIQYNDWLDARISDGNIVPANEYERDEVDA